MTAEEAIKEVIICMPDTEAREIVIEALEKRIKKKPIKDKMKRIQCLNGHNQPTQHYKYCPMCGQHIDWSE